MKYTGVTARGILTPIFQEGDDLVTLIVDSLLRAAEQENFLLNDRDIIGVTEAVLGRTQGNYATCSQIASDLTGKLGGRTIGVVFPIMSRNRFAPLLKAVSMSAEKVYVQFSYPADEVGNRLIDWEQFDQSGINPYSDHMNESEFRAIFDQDATRHLFTGVDYIEHYKEQGNNIEVIFSNDPTHILRYTKNVLICDVHARNRTRRLIKQAGGERVFGLDQILTRSVDGSGYNPEFGLLGSNKATEDKVKLFPRDAQLFVDDLAEQLLQRTGKHIEVMIYGDGCFKDPIGGIWELADPVVSPAYTPGLEGTPNELKIKYFADNEFSDLKGEELAQAVRERIRNKDTDLVGSMASQGTTPRRITDLVGSLCDLVSGSGDRGTPVVLIQGYFTNFATI
ncbi:MAG: F420-0--gamma-glutamyl ligase [Clostridiaceae bacterium]|jgi:F420-0:gamma-glutamyl ligase|nr:F420-0--gamma-glutamyl ligase [Clostridiaceae bacterium]